MKQYQVHLAKKKEVQEMAIKEKAEYRKSRRMTNVIESDIPEAIW